MTTEYMEPHKPDLSYVLPLGGERAISLIQSLAGKRITQHELRVDPGAGVSASELKDLAESCLVRVYRINAIGLMRFWLKASYVPTRNDDRAYYGIPTTQPYGLWCLIRLRDCAMRSGVAASVVFNMLADTIGMAGTWSIDTNCECVLFHEAALRLYMLAREHDADISTNFMHRAEKTKGAVSDVIVQVMQRRKAGNPIPANDQVRMLKCAIDSDIAAGERAEAPF